MLLPLLLIVTTTKVLLMPLPLKSSARPYAWTYEIHEDFIRTMMRDPELELPGGKKQFSFLFFFTGMLFEL